MPVPVPVPASLLRLGTARCFQRAAAVGFVSALTCADLVGWCRIKCADKQNSTCTTQCGAMVTRLKTAGSDTTLNCRAVYCVAEKSVCHVDVPKGAGSKPTFDASQLVGKINA